MLTIGICDDENKYIIEIKKYIDAHYTSNKRYRIQTFQDGYEVIANINHLDILFLDIEMPGLSGIEIKERVQFSNCKIIFVTNHEHHMEEAFGRNVIFFIKKDSLHKIPDILRKIEIERKEHSSICINNDIIKSSEILYAKADGSYTCIFTVSKDYFYCIYLSQLLQRIDNGSFVKTHRSYFINLRYIKKILHNKIILINNIEVPLSRKHKVSVSEKVFHYMEERI